MTLSPSDRASEHAEHIAQEYQPRHRWGDLCDVRGIYTWPQDDDGPPLGNPNYGGRHRAVDLAEHTDAAQRRILDMARKP